MLTTQLSELGVLSKIEKRIVRKSLESLQSNVFTILSKVPRKGELPEYDKLRVTNYRHYLFGNKVNIINKLTGKKLSSSQVLKALVNQSPSTSSMAVRMLPFTISPALKPKMNWLNTRPARGKKRLLSAIGRQFAD